MGGSDGFDSTRRAVGPIEVDLIEAYAAKRISRRDFVRRGLIVGLSGSQLAAVVAACSSSVSTSESTAATPTAGGPTPTVAAIPTATPQPARPAVPTAEPAPPPEATRTTATQVTAGIQFGDANSGLDPLNMLDLGTYATVTQCFEYLVGIDDRGNIAPTGLAERWSPNADGTEWTFTLREGVRWHDGSPLTSADVAATLDRMASAGTGLLDVLSEGAVRTPDDQTIIASLERPEGQFPVLVSTYNAPSVITPVDYSDGTTLDARNTGTGPWRFINHDPVTFTTQYVANDDYWGGRPSLDSLTLVGFDRIADGAEAMANRQIDIVQSFDVFNSPELLSDPSLTVLAPPSSNHRQIWFNTQVPRGGPFTDSRVRQAVAYCLDREAMVEQLLVGRGVVANDHPIHPSLPYFGQAVPQRTRDIERARQLLADAGHSDLEATIEVGDVFLSSEVAVLIEQQCAEAGIVLSVNVTANADFYGAQWCPGAIWGRAPDTSGPTIPCGESAPMGIVDWGHRPTPDVPLGRGLLTDADWNSANYASPRLDELYVQYRSAVDVESQTAAANQIQQVLHEDTPVLIPFFFDYLAAHDASITGVQATSLGHLKLERAQRRR